ncbi:MAG TPA: GTP cyclohydrolase II RibA [Caulobacteraceae bacterium]|nr:GTP cyclohydrolase II RibA [Caulobacteraceae bacterium]
MTALIGDKHQVAGQRAVAELRAGRPISIEHGRDAILAAALDGASPSLFAAFADMAKGSIILSAQRGRVLGLPVEHAVSAPLAGLDLPAAQRLAAAPSHAPPAHWRIADASAEAAVQLCGQALVLPAALAAPLASAPPEGLFRVRLEAIAAATAPAPDTPEIVSAANVPLASGVVGRFVVFRSASEPRDQLAVVVGDPDPAQPVLVRVHSACLTGDLFGSLKCDCGDQLHSAMDRLAAEGGGVLLYLDQEGRGIGIGNKMRAYALQQDGLDTIDADAVLGFSADERRFESAAAMLLKLGFSKIVLLTNNPEKIGALTRAGLDVVARRPLYGCVTPQNRSYLSTKAARANHALAPLLKPPAAGASS